MRAPVADYPRLVQPLVERYGPEAVWRASLETIDLPPMLVGKYEEVAAIAAALETPEAGV